VGVVGWLGVGGCGEGGGGGWFGSRGSPDNSQGSINVLLVQDNGHYSV